MESPKKTANPCSQEIPSVPCIKVGMSSCGIAAGAQEVFTTLADEVSKRKLDLHVGRCGCSGSCYAEPLVQVFVPGLPPVTYGRVDRNVALRILDEHVGERRLINDYIIDLSIRRR